MTDVVVDICVSLGVLGLGLGAGIRGLMYGDAVTHVFKRKTHFLLCLIGLYVCLAVILLHAPHVNIWPLSWRLHGLNATWLIMRALLLGACGVAIAVSWQISRHQVIAIALIGMVGVVGFWGLEHYLMSPIYPFLDSSPSAHSVVKQTSSSSCAPAALATVFKQWNMEISEAEVAKLAQTSRMGTSMPHLIAAAQQLGMEGVELEPSWETMQRINRPGVLSVWVQDGDRRLPHAVALLGMSHKAAIIADPASGKAFNLSRRELESMWRHEYVPIVRQSDISLAEGQALDYLAQITTLDGKKSQRGSRFVDHNRFSDHLNHFQRRHHGLRRSGKLDPATMLVLQGPFIQEGPTLSSQESYPMTIADYHHVQS